MPHLLYDEVRREKQRGRQKKNPDGTKQKRPEKVFYRNMLAPPGEYDFDREIGRASLLATQMLGPRAIIAGFPRWFTGTDRHGDPVTHNIIDKGFVVTSEQVRRVLGSRALDEGRGVLLDQQGHLRVQRTGKVGRRVAYKHEKRTKADGPDKVSLLYSSALEKPGPAQRDLRRLKRSLEDLASRVPVTQQSTYFKKPPLDHHELRIIVRRAAQGAGSLGELDSNIREMNLELRDYIDDSHIQAIHEHMPRQMRIAGQLVDVRYLGDDAIPIAVGYPFERASNLKDIERIPDGREILFSFAAHGHERLLPAHELKKYWLSGV